MRLKWYCMLIEVLINRLINSFYYHATNMYLILFFTKKNITSIIITPYFNSAIFTSQFSFVYFVPGVMNKFSENKCGQKLKTEREGWDYWTVNFTGTLCSWARGLFTLDSLIKSWFMIHKIIPLKDVNYWQKSMNTFSLYYS